MLTCSGVKRDLNLVTVNPAVENTLSAGVDAIGMVIYLLAIQETRGNLYWFSFHHVNGGSSLYLLASLSNMIPFLLALNLNLLDHLQS